MQTKILISILLSTLIIIGNFECYTSALIEVKNGFISITFDDGWHSVYDYAFPILTNHSMTATYYVISSKVGTPGYMNAAELIALQSAGNEIGSHSVSHPVFSSLTTAQIRYECSESKTILESLGLVVNNFAYPFGDADSRTNSIVSEYYRSARRAYIPPYVMDTSNVGFNLTGYSMENSTLPTLKSFIDWVYSSKGWATVFFHKLTPVQTADRFSITVSDFSSLLDYISEKKIHVLTVNDALNLFGKPAPTPTPVPTVVPTLTPEPTPEPTIVPSSTSKPNSEPTPVPTVVPTLTPEPTPEPTIVPSSTPKPTPVPTPSVTSVPTIKPTPWSTPSPTSTPTPTPTATKNPYSLNLTNNNLLPTFPKTPQFSPLPAFPLSFLANIPYYAKFMALLIIGLTLTAIVVYKNKIR